MAHRSATPRLPARKHWLPETAIYHTLVRPAFRRSFHRIAIHAPHGEGWNDLPTLYYANHVSWWDGWIAFFLFHERWRVEGYLMMEERQLERYRFWQRCGCFSVDRSDPREGMRSVLYAADLLRSKPRRSLWIFPQGEIGPNDHRPLHTFTGAAQLARRAGRVRCVPVALRFEFRGEQRPEALVRIGEPHIADGTDAKILHAEMDQRLLREVDALHDDLNNGTVTDYQTALTGQVSINVWWDRVRATGARPRGAPADE